MAFGRLGTLLAMLGIIFAGHFAGSPSQAEVSESKFSKPTIHNTQWLGLNFFVVFTQRRIEIDMGVEKKCAVEEMLKKACQNLHREWDNYHLVQEVLQNLTAATRDKRFRIQNNFIWRSLLAMHRQLYSDVFSLCRGIYKKNGVLDQLQSYGNAFRLIGKTKIMPLKGDKELREYNHRCVCSAFERVFPSCKSEPGVNPSPGDWLEIKEKIEKFAKDIGPARHHHAHFYEIDPSAELQQISLETVAKVLEALNELICDLHLILTQETFLMPKREDRASGVFADDIVDLLLIGPVRMRRFVELEHMNEHPKNRSWREKRKEMYEQLHETPGDSVPPFNDGDRIDRCLAQIYKKDV